MKEIVLVYKSGNPGFMICEEKFIQQILEALKDALGKNLPYFNAYDEAGRTVAQFELKDYRGFYIREHLMPSKILPDDLIELQKTCLKEIIKEMKKGDEWQNES